MYALYLLPSLLLLQGSVRAYFGGGFGPGSNFRPQGHGGHRGLLGTGVSPYGSSRHVNTNTQGHASSSDLCRRSETSVSLTVLTSDGDVLPHAWIYYTTGKGHMRVSETNQQGIANFKTNGCSTTIVVNKKNFDVGIKKDLRLNGDKVSCTIELIPPCNFWLYVSDAETSTPLEDAHIVFTTKGVSGVVKTDSYGEACLYASEGKELRVVASKEGMTPGILEVRADCELCDYAHLSVPPQFHDYEKLKGVLNWCGYGGLHLEVGQFSGYGESCHTNSEHTCKPLKRFGYGTNGYSGGEMIVWNKHSGHQAFTYVLFVFFNSPEFFKSQVRFVAYSHDGSTEMVQLSHYGNQQYGYWIIGCIEGDNLKTFYEINRISNTKPDQTTCNQYRGGYGHGGGHGGHVSGYGGHGSGHRGHGSGHGGYGSGHGGHGKGHGGGNGGHSNNGHGGSYSNNRGHSGSYFG